MKIKPGIIWVVVSCMIWLGCGCDQQKYGPWRIYYSDEYYGFSDADGRITDDHDGYTTEEEAKTTMEKEIHVYQVKHAKRVWREAPNVSEMAAKLP